MGQYGRLEYNQMLIDWNEFPDGIIGRDALVNLYEDYRFSVMIGNFC